MRGKQHRKSSDPVAVAPTAAHVGSIPGRPAAAKTEVTPVSPAQTQQRNFRSPVVLPEARRVRFAHLWKCQPREPPPRGKSFSRGCCTEWLVCGFRGVRKLGVTTASDFERNRLREIRTSLLGPHMLGASSRGEVIELAGFRHPKVAPWSCRSGTSTAGTPAPGPSARRRASGSH